MHADTSAEDALHSSRYDHTMAINKVALIECVLLSSVKVCLKCIPKAATDAGGALTRSTVVLTSRLNEQGCEKIRTSSMKVQQDLTLWPDQLCRNAFE
eukprot:3746289-Amphidinium_carterae.1